MWDSGHWVGDGVLLICLLCGIALVCWVDCFAVVGVEVQDADLGPLGHRCY